MIDWHLVWFCLLTGMIAVYAMLDGFDLGAGAIHPFVTRDTRERSRLIRTIGPVWDGNEVWLIAAGGTMFLAFPILYAVSFSGFYLPLFIVLWSLMIRGVSLELRGHVRHVLWEQFWDGAFFVGSALLALFYGVALGNVLRGVPIDASGYFFEPLWTTWNPQSPHPGILDWFTLLVGIQALATLAGHGANWVALKTDADLAGRCQKASAYAWLVTGVLTALSTWALFWLEPQLWANFQGHPWGALFPAAAGVGIAVWAAGLWAIRDRARAERTAFGGSTTYVAAMLASCAFVLYPVVLPATDSRYSLTVDKAATSLHGMQIGAVWWIPAIVLVVGYFAIIYRLFAGKVPGEVPG